MADEIVTAYHFVGSTLRDGRLVPPDGEWLIHDGPVEMCKSGLHASRHPFDALQYAPGHTLCRVEVADIVAEESDKLVCLRRRIVARIDATELCRYFARRCALDVIGLWEAPEVVRRYLETGDETIRAAASDAAWDATSAAARAARRAASDAARDAWDAAMDAARDAAWDAAWAAVRAAQRARFAEMVEAAFAEVRYDVYRRGAWLSAGVAQQRAQQGVGVLSEHRLQHH